jgi:N-acetylneuraminic acid mutarotase
MKKIFTLLFLLAFFNVHGQNTWVSKGDLTNGLSYSACFTLGDYGYLVGGSNDNDFTNSTWEYDVSNDVWTQVANLGVTSRFGGIGFSVNGKGFAGMGVDINDNILTDLHEYNPFANTWSSKTNIPQGRFAAAVMVEGNRVFVASGCNDIINLTVLKDVWEYNEANDTWSSRSPLPGSARYAASGFSCNGACYLFGGASADADTIFNELWLYNPSSDAWLQQNSLPSGPLGGTVGFNIGSFGFIGTGLDLFFSYNEFWQYDCINDSWIPVASLPGDPRDGAFCFVINNKAYVGGGVDDNVDVLSDVYEYTPDSGVISVNEINYSDINISLSPNPAITNLKFKIESSIQLTNSTIRIYNLTGSLVQLIKLKSNETMINVESLHSGMYFYSISTEEKIITSGKFIVSHD